MGVKPVNYLAFCKPYEVLSQFTDSAGRATLKDYVPIPGVYAAGRLDYRSEGLLLLSDDGAFIHQFSDPRYDHPKVYLCQVEGIATPDAIQQLDGNIVLPGIQQYPARAERTDEPRLPAPLQAGERLPPHILAKNYPAGGQKAPGAAHDRSNRLPHLATDPSSHRTGIPGELKPGEWRRLSESESAVYAQGIHG